MRTIAQVISAKVHGDLEGVECDAMISGMFDLRKPLRGLISLQDVQSGSVADFCLVQRVKLCIDIQHFFFDHRPGVAIGDFRLAGHTH